MLPHQKNKNPMVGWSDLHSTLCSFDCSVWRQLTVVSPPAPVALVVCKGTLKQELHCLCNIWLLWFPCKLFLVAIAAPHDLTQSAVCVRLRIEFLLQIKSLMHSARSVLLYLNKVPNRYPTLSTLSLPNLSSDIVTSEGFVANWLRNFSISGEETTDSLV